MSFEYRQALDHRPRAGLGVSGGLRARERGAEVSPRARACGASAIQEGGRPEPEMGTIQNLVDQMGMCAKASVVRGLVCDKPRLF